MLEFALVTPTLLLLCFGAMDLSRAFRSAMISAAAARAGVHYASSSEAASENTPGIVAAATQDAGIAAGTDDSDSSGIRVGVERYCTCAIGAATVPCEVSCTNKSKYVKVTTAIPFEATVKLPGLSPMHYLRSTSHVRVK